MSDLKEVAIAPYGNDEARALLASLGPAQVTAISANRRSSCSQPGSTRPLVSGIRNWIPQCSNSGAISPYWLL
jgi:hypothetical protein